MLHLPKPVRLFTVNKKGFAISYKMIMWIPRFFFTVIVIALTFYIISAFIITKTNVSGPESSILMDVAHYSPGGFSAFDVTTGRVYPGIVDNSRFTTAQLQQLFQQDKPAIVGRFTEKQTIVDYFISPQDEVIRYADGTPDGARYLRWEPIALVNAKGEGSFTPYPEVRYVAIKDGSGAVMETVFIASN